MLRLERNLKQIYMANAMQTTVETYRNIEHGRVDVNTGKLEVIAGALSVSVSMIILLAEDLSA